MEVYTSWEEHSNRLPTIRANFLTELIIGDVTNDISGLLKVWEIEGLPQLKALSLIRCKLVQDNFVVSLLALVATSLEKLTLVGCDKLVGNHWPVLDFPKLSFLHVKDCLAMLKLDSLRMLDLEIAIVEHAFASTRMLFQYFAHHCPKLRNLVITANQGEVVDSGGYCKRMLRLEVLGIGHIAAFARKFMQTELENMPLVALKLDFILGMEPSCFQHLPATLAVLVCARTAMDKEHFGAFCKPTRLRMLQFGEQTADHESLLPLLRDRCPSLVFCAAHNPLSLTNHSLPGYESLHTETGVSAAGGSMMSLMTKGITPALREVRKRYLYYLKKD